MVLELEDVPLKEREPLQRRGSKFPIPISPYPSGTLQGLLTPYTPIGRNFEETGDMGIGNLLQFLFHHSRHGPLLRSILSLRRPCLYQLKDHDVNDGTEIGEPLIIQ
jgi:hypothetical protein